MDPSKSQLLTTSTSPAHYTNLTHMYLQPLKPKHRPQCDSEGSKPQEHEVGVVGEGVRGVVTVDDHTHLMGWDMMEMGMKQNTMTRTKNHAHSVYMILHEHKVRGGMCLFDGRRTSSVFYSSITKMCCDKTDMNKPFLIKKNIKTKRTKTDQKRPNHDAYNTQTNIHKHWSQ